MPSQNSNTHGCRSLLQARNAWLIVMISCINFQFCLGKDVERCGLRHGPATLAPKAAHMRLAIAADAFVDRCPDDVVLKDWAPDLSQASVSYTGEGVLTCLKARAGLVAGARVAAHEPDGLAAFGTTG